MYDVWKKTSGEYDPKDDKPIVDPRGNVHTQNETKFKYWAMEQYGMTAEEYRGYTVEGTLKTLEEIDMAKDKVMIALALPGMIKNAVKATKDFANGVPVDTSIALTAGSDAAGEGAKEVTEKTTKDITKYIKGIDFEGRDASKVGNFSGLEKSTINEILDRIPDNATLRKLYPIEGGSTDGFEFKWKQNGQTYRVRLHNADPSAPLGSNAANGWIVRIQKGRQYYDPTIDNFQPAKYTNPSGPFLDEKIINNTHIPIKDPYKP